MGARPEGARQAQEDGLDSATENTDEPAGAASELKPIATEPTKPFKCKGVDVEPGDDLAEVAEREPPGATFCIRSGVHRVGEVLAQTGDKFIGESGAVLNGARNISADKAEWRQVGDAWVLGGQKQQSEPLATCFPKSEPCIEGAGAGLHPNQRNEELFVDNKRFQHVASKSELGPGTWFFDYGANEIWLGEDPSSLGKIETSVYEGAIGADDATDVVIDNLVIEKYANLPGRGAVGGWNTPNYRDKRHDYRWTFRNITGRLNHGAAVLLMEGDRLENCLLTHNGQLGFKAIGHRDEASGDRMIPKDFDQRIVIRDCEIAYNNQLGYRPGWEAGGFKITEVVGGSLVENVWSHHNRGAGMWLDAFNRDAVVRSNLVEDNLEEGIFYELSYGGTEIYWNSMRNNGARAQDKYSSKGIFLSNAEGVKVYENAVTGSIMSIHIRSSARRAIHSRNNKIYDNDFKPAATRACNGVGTYQGDDQQVTSPSSGNKFSGNLWRLESASAAVFCWGDGQRSRLTAAEMPGNDDVTTDQGEPALPGDATPFKERDFGAQ